MNELEPLLDTSESLRTRELLRAGRSDAPGHGFSERLLVGLGLGVAASSVSVVASAGTAGVALQGAASTGSGAASLTVLAAKWVAVGVVGGGILAGSADVAFKPRAAEPIAVQATRGAPAARGPLATTPVAPVVTAPVTEEATLPEPPERPAAAPASGAPSARPGQLGREVEAIDRARRAMASGDMARALKELNAFDRIASTGVLAREAQVLRIEALHGVGQSARARQLTSDYLKIYPNDSHATRLRALDPGKD